MASMRPGPRVPLPRPKPAAPVVADPEQEALVREAVQELTSLQPAEAEALVFELLSAAAEGDVSLFSLLGYTERDLFTIYRKAHTLQKAGFPKQALDLCEGLLALNPGHLPFKLMAACCWLDLQDYAKALQLLDQLCAEHATDLEVHLKRGLALFRLKRPVEAGLAWKQVLDLDPGMATDEAKQAQFALDHLQQQFQKK